MNSVAPYERARQLEAQGRTVDEIRAALKREGVSDDDVAVVMGSLGKLAEPQTTVVPKPLATVTRVLHSRAMLAVVFVAAALALAPFVWLGWLMWSGLRQGR